MKMKNMEGNCYYFLITAHERMSEFVEVVAAAISASIWWQPVGIIEWRDRWIQPNGFEKEMKSMSVVQWSVQRTLRDQFRAGQINRCSMQERSQNFQKKVVNALWAWSLPAFFPLWISNMMFPVALELARLCVSNFRTFLTWAGFG